ncbi:MAG: tRNA 2-selenouridine(34) synthase MnmH [Bacteroidetes bacterium]|nr:tRNA 2-selenouridine(34) synthase MnmH [Bacteroidota bacterium]
MKEQILPEEFLKLSRTFPVIDVRSEKEYLSGHIPGAINLPLFNDEERAVVGTLFKNSGRDASVLKGLELAGPKLADFVKKLHRITLQKEILVHCWRGGMRSASMAWLFEQAGYKVFLLEGGYKAYRRFVREKLSLPVKIIILGGLTGSGKTELLHLLEKEGEQILDLEQLASHKGSVFGGLRQPVQPCNEQFENNLFSQWELLDASRPVWIEDESRMIGNVGIPEPLFEQMIRAVMIKVESSREQRIRRLVNEYSEIEKQDLKDAILKISEKLGGTNAKTALAAIDSGDYATVAGLALSHYDKSYTHSLLKRVNLVIHTIVLESDDPLENAKLVLNAGKSIPENNP